MVKILAPIDYSNSSVAALKHAAALAREADGTLLVLHVVDAGSESVSPKPEELNDPLRQEVVQLLQSLSKSEHPVRFDEWRVEGIPVSAILSVAANERADLIVMGTTGRTGLKRFLLGSVAEGVIRQATCPVLTLKAESRPSDDDRQSAFWDHLTLHGKSASETDPVDVLTQEEIRENPTLGLISRAIASRATDIHIDPVGREFSVRLRIDGRLIDYCRLSNEIGRSLISQIKVTANLDIADPFHPLEGRLDLPDSLRDFEVRVTSVPVVNGEAMSLRVLSRSRLMRPMEQLGLSSDAQSEIEQMLRHREGIVLVTGPTGSGKTTTLYSLLRALDDGSRNIVSVEDPVEYDIPTFRQVCVDRKHGISMTHGLRTLLRLDPDVVFVGEIRDAEAAETAMRAASSGKYVFSSLHTRDVASTVTALRDLHIDNRSLAGNLAGVISQRLLKRLCQECCRPAAPTEQEVAVFRANGIQPPNEIRHPVGCPRCRGTGYYDRVGVFEVLTSDIGILRAIEDGESEDQLRRLIHAHGVSTLKKDALQKVAAGILSLEECATMTEIHLDVQQVSPADVNSTSSMDCHSGLLVHSM